MSLLPNADPSSILRVAGEALRSPVDLARKAAAGRVRFLDRYEMSANAARLAGWLRAAVA